MNNPLQALIQMGAVPIVTFPPDSRYAGFGALTYMWPNGQTVSYLQRRFAPQQGAPNFASVAQHTVVQGDRLDLLAAKYLGDPLLFWLICDANGAIQPSQLETPGTILSITLPQGVPGGPGNA